MARTYEDTITLVRNWTNRDMSALPDAIIQDGLRWAADKCYRTLRIPPLESTAFYSNETGALTAATQEGQDNIISVTELSIPTDLIEFIQIREVNPIGSSIRVFNEKSDVRTFNDNVTYRYNQGAAWARQGECILLQPGFNIDGDAAGIELYYYRRLPALDATYALTFSNWVSGLGTLDTNPHAGETEEEFDALVDGGAVWSGQPVPNWLRDENERILLMGALAECFAYLQEDDQAQKYAALFLQEIEELNREDKMRLTSGGNLQINYDARLI